MERFGITPSRALGQNFMVEPGTARRIARLARVGEGDQVVEVGSGLGALTLALLETGAAVLAVEADRRLAAALESIIAEAGLELPTDPSRPTVDVRHADALRVDWDELLGRESEGWVLVSNLPYNVATPLIISLLEEVPQIERFVVLVQREAGERMVAGPGSGTYGIPSVKIAYYANARLVGRVGPNVFLPKPKVESVVVELVRRSEPAVDAEPDVLFTLVRRAFGQRRKMLRRSLAGVVDDDQFHRAGLDSAMRPEEIGIEAWGRLADAVGSIDDGDQEDSL